MHSNKQLLTVYLKKEMLIFISSFRESQHNKTAESVKVDYC